MKQLLIVDDDASIRSVLKEALEGDKFSVDLAKDATVALEMLKKTSYDLIVSDLVMPEISGLELLEIVKKEFPNIGFLMITAYGSIETAVNSLQKGAFDFITKPFSITQIETRVDRFFNFVGLQEENKQLKQKLSEDKQFKKLIGNSDNMRVVYNQIAIISKSDAPVFIEGESGTGKELIAEAIHDSSDRSDKPFLKVNCSAIPDTLIESTLFGNEKGAYTSATKMNRGFFEEADGGTFLLDEITEMPLALQAKLLRVLQEGTITRVGSSKEIKVDVRIIATSNRKIQKMVNKNEFRSDLFYRLNVFPIKVPALRTHPEDIPLLVTHFIAKNKLKYTFEHKEIEKKTLDKLLRYNWPGNIRELENLTERAILYAGNTEILTNEHFSFESEQGAEAGEEFSGALISIAEMEKKMIYNTLKKTNNNRTQAADILGISVRTLRNKLHEYEDNIEQN